MNAPSVDNRIEEFRRRKGWSQSVLAKKVGVAYTQIAKWERGFNAPSLGWAIVLSKELEVTVNELFPLKD